MESSNNQMESYTLIRHIMESEHLHDYSTGELSGLLTGISVAAKLISREVNKAGLADILGLTGKENVQGEAVQKLDIYADSVVRVTMEKMGQLCLMASEEEEGPITIPSELKKGKYVMAFDPLDGSSNIDVNVSIGTIFSIYRRKSKSGDGSIDDLLQQGRQQVAAGYVIYGSSTMLVYTTGSGVHGFTLDPSIGEFLLSHPNIRMPERSSTYSINEAYDKFWHPGTRQYIDNMKNAGSSARYIGTLVSDFHRNLLRGGIFIYPQDKKDPAKSNGKLRLLYECNPMAMLAVEAGGLASTGDEQILDIKPESLHQRVPLVIGSRDNVLEYEKVWQRCRS